MKSGMTLGRRILVLGPDTGWHADRLRDAAKTRGDAMDWGRYETLAARLDLDGGQDVTCEVVGQARDGDAAQENRIVSLRTYDHVLARTMPVGSLEQITLRLNVLHTLVAEGRSVVNRPDALEIAIDKYRTLARVAALGYAVPATEVVQSRGEAMRAFDQLGGDVVVKPLFGGEGRGVMRIQDRELAWTTFTTLERLDAVVYVQAFVRPGGVDTRLLVIGKKVFGVRRFAVGGWKTNVSQGGRSEAFVPSSAQLQLARRVADDFGLTIGTVDLLETEDQTCRVVEVNAVPGWKGAEGVLGIDIAGEMLAALERE